MIVGSELRELVPCTIGGRFGRGFEVSVNERTGGGGREDGGGDNWVWRPLSCNEPR